MSHVETKLRPQQRLDLKWLKSDLQAVFYSQDSLNYLWNGLMNDGELTGPFSDGLLNSAGVTARKGELGKYYCGLRVLTCTCCDGICGPTNGCNCQPCQKLDAEEQNAKQEEKRLPSPQFLLDSWTWGPQPSFEQLRTFILCLNHEQRKLCLDAVNSSLSSTRLQQRLTIFKRYFIALNRAPHTTEFNTNIALRNSNVGTKDCRIIGQRNRLQDPTASLARVGSRAALNFSFAFLRRAWRLGEDVDLCNELLLESLEALQVLPVATLFDESQVSPIWLEVVDRSIKFLRQVVIGDVTSGRQYCEVPLEDQHVSLNLLLELAIQKGTLSSILDIVLLLLQLWEKKAYSDDNRSLPANASAPLLPFLKRFEEISLAKSPPASNDEKEDTPNCTNMFLKYLTIPEDETADVDLKQAAILLMSHLDRLASPHLPSQSFNKTNINTNRQQVWCWGWLAWLETNVGPQLCDAISELNIKQLRCSERSLLALTKDGKVYCMYFCSETPCPQLIEGLKEKEIIKIAAHTEGKHYLALTKDSEVYSWGNGDNGRLGHGDNTSKDEPTLIAALKHKDIVDIECGGTYSAAIAANGALYTWGRGNYGRLGHGTCEDCSTPTMVAAVSDQHVVRIACGSGDAHTLCVTNQGKVYSWGDGDYGKLGRGGSDGSKIPRLVEKLQNIEIGEVYCGGQFSMALSTDGRLFSWGKGEGWRLGHATDEHIRFPEVVESLHEKKVVSVSLGLGHVLALTDQGEVYGWGKNEYKQICDTTESYIQQPRLIETLKMHRSVGICCGPMQSFVWSDFGHWIPSVRVPFVIDITEQTFKLLDQLLEVVCENSRTSSSVNLPISQDKEYVAIATLNLLHLQVCTKCEFTMVTIDIIKNDLQSSR
ncbi:HERC2 [Trypoxylus dichotomus]